MQVAAVQEDHVLAMEVQGIRDMVEAHPASARREDRRDPPLRQLTGNILPLARLFLRVLSAEHGKTHPDISPSAAADLQVYDWPANMRELRNEIERATLLAPDGAPVEMLLIRGSDLLMPPSSPVFHMPPGRPVEMEHLGTLRPVSGDQAPLATVMARQAEQVFRQGLDPTERDV